jgi:hypothetical protein
MKAVLRAGECRGYIIIGKGKEGTASPSYERKALSTSCIISFSDPLYVFSINSCMI